MTPQNSIDRTIDMLESQYNSYYNDIQLLYENNRQLQINIQENARTLLSMYNNNNTNINFLYQNLDYLRSLMRELNTLNTSVPTTTSPPFHFSPTAPVFHYSAPTNPPTTSVPTTSFDPSSSFGFFCSCGIFHNHSLCSSSNEINTPLYTRSTGLIPTLEPIEIPQTNTPQTNTTQTNTPQTNTPQTNTTQSNTTQTNTTQSNTTQTNTTQTNTTQSNTRNRNRFDFYYFVSNNTHNDITDDDDIPDLVDVVVRPTFEQIQNAVRNIQYSTIIEPINDSCPISLEPFQQQDNVTQINQCNHIFNTNELNHWFESNVQCPVCRYDIRNYQTPQTTQPTTNTTSRITRSRSRNRNIYQSSPIPTLTPDTIPTFIPNTNPTTPQTTPIANIPSRRNRHIRYNTDRITSINDINWNDLLYYVAESVIDFSDNNI